MDIEKQIRERREDAERVQRGRSLMAYHRQLALEQVQLKKVLMDKN